MYKDKAEIVMSTKAVDRHRVGVLTEWIFIMSTLAVDKVNLECRFLTVYSWEDMFAQCKNNFEQAPRCTHPNSI